LKSILKISILFIFLIFGSGFNNYAQNLPLACGGSIVRYGVTGGDGSIYDWNVVGGDVILDLGDTITVQWNSVSGIHFISVTEISFLGCVGDLVLDTVLISSPFIDLGIDVEICQNETVEFIASSADFTDYLWQDNSIGETFIASASGDYWVRVTDVEGCQATDSVAVIVHDLPIVDLGSDTTLCAVDALLTLDPSDNWGNDFEWYYNEDKDPIYFSPTIEVSTRTEEQRYWVSVTDEFGCEGTDTIVVRFCGELEIPNVFTPNGDYINDVWEITQLYVFEDLTIDIFDRFGNRIFHSDGYSSENYWDGTNQKGKKLPMDTYYYVIDLHNGEQPIVGNVTLVR
jgi:gliding motility-associated-like protein